MMKQSGLLRLLYILFAFLTLLYTFFGLVISFNAGPALSDGTFESSYQIGTDSMPLGTFILITGIPMFLLFLFLYWRSGRINAPRG